MKHICILFIFLLLQVSCKTGKPFVINLPQLNTNELIQDCPEEIIVDYMPSSAENYPRYYYIYKGVNRTATDFDTVWVRKNCSPKITRVD